MSSPTRAIAIVAAAAIFILLVAAPPSAALTCSDVLKDMKPCITYLKSGSGMPPSACCTGAGNLASAATTTADKQSACACLKNAAKNVTPKPELAKALPGNCGISLPFEVSPNVDCTKVT
ncbi:non-specific lipid-transfer protein 8-like [Andrographis paniculata]|uniref:non-specific lipid-transfer protein 8-like n=1 Tax=Andrographis paniculata TaxID=175694 RepID=UPI0021E730FE|nr:non-specific lipid-transfer protein 8-like [Andrographis paniculata]